ncbi:MAG: hypothetical protein JJE47_07520 [Acidimicrobiia bacterium]|nr:hypothetical protein [Acidimicrobiia bacterium]
MEQLGVYWERAIGRIRTDERGLNTAELLGNAALAIVALIAIWAGLQALGIDVIERIRSLLFGQL